MTDQKYNQRTHTKTSINQTQYLFRACSEDSKVEIMAQVCVLEYLGIDCTDVELLTQGIVLAKAVLKRDRNWVCKGNIQETKQRQWQERPHRRWPGYHRWEKKEGDYVIRVFLVRRMFTRRLCACPTNSRRFHDLRPYSEDSRWPGWQVVIGIETHAQIRSRQKLFSGTPLAHLNTLLVNILSSDSQTSALDASPNIHVSPFDAAFPGTLPVRTTIWVLQSGKLMRLNLENQSKMCRPCNTHCTGIEMSDIFSVIFWSKTLLLLGFILWISNYTTVLYVPTRQFLNLFSFLLL